MFVLKFCIFAAVICVCVFLFVFGGGGVEGYIGVSVMFLASDIWEEGWDVHHLTWHSGKGLASV